MKRCMLWIIALAFLQASAFAQNLTGTWQGTLKVRDRELRTVIKIETTATDSLKATMYSIDQGAGAIAGDVTQQGSAVKISIPGIGGTYEGKLSADGKSIAGTWSQGPQPLPLSLERATADTAWAIPKPPAPSKPMPAGANPSFEVATIKPSKPGTPGKLLTMRGSEFSTLNTTVSDLMGFAYGVHPRQIVGAPSWIESDKFDILAKPDQEGIPNRNQLTTMIQKLLADRFQLKFHHDKKELSVYALEVAKSGPKMTKSAGDPNGLPSLLFRGLGVLPVRNATMEEFATVMQAAVLDRPVVDRTGIQGRWDFLLKWTPDETQFSSFGVQIRPPTNSADAPPDLFTAIQQEIGLKLESTKAPVDVLVIDQMEKPSAN